LATNNVNYHALAASEMPSQIQKLEAHASHLLDAFILLRERYAMLAPMVFEEGVVSKYVAKARSRGFQILRNTLFLACAQDIAKLALDKDERAPSIRNLVAALASDDLRREFRDRYSNWAIAPVSETDPEVVAALKKMQVSDHAERAQRFDELYCELTGLWAKLSISSALGGFQAVRDKISAHSEVRYLADKYQFVDVGTLGIKWGDLEATIVSMERAVEILGLLVRNAGFAWEMLDEKLSSAATEFWE
jgi:hypothetical protein